jgi:hypothetical protein
MRTFTIHKQKPITMKTDTQKHTLGNWSHVPTTAIGARPSTVRRDIVADSEFGPAFIAGDILLDHAKLIASAPDLLSALEFLLADYLAINGESLTGSSVPADKAREAIRKAKGLA